MASTLVALQTVTVGAGGAASIEFTNIPQTYTDIIVKMSVRSSDTTNNTGDYDALGFQFNGSQYGYLGKELQGSGSAASSVSRTTITISSSTYGRFNGIKNSYNGNTAFENFEMYIPNYILNNYKSISIDSVGEQNATDAMQIANGSIWQNTDAITSIKFALQLGTFVEYSTATLYGVYNSPLDTAVEAPTIGTATAASTGANVAFTPSGTGAPATSYVATSSPGGITATGTTSPILVTGLTSGTAYTFTVKGQNPGGTGAASAASNSVTPYDGYESIATGYSSGSIGTITFSSIPSSYTHLQLRVFARSATASTGQDDLQIKFNSDTGSNYSAHRLYGQGTTASSGGFTSQSVVHLDEILCRNSNTASVFSGIIVDILDYKNTNKYKTVRALGGNDNNGSGTIAFDSGLWMSTSAVTQLDLQVSGGANFITGSVFELYGIRG